MDIFAFCGCKGFPAPNLCPFCRGSNVATARTIPTDGFATTCLYLESIAPFVTDIDYCIGTVQLLSDFCPCQSNGDSGEEGRCTLCPNRDKAKNASAEIPFSGGQTCSSLEETLSNIPTALCAEAREEMEKIFDIPALCGCDGVQPAKVCSLCPEDGPIEDPALEIPEAQGMTCQDFSDLATLVKSRQVCGDIFDPLSRACCASDKKCSVCPVGSEMAYPDRIFKLAGIPEATCSWIESNVVYLTNDECLDFHDENS